MALVIPDGFANFLLTITNATGGLSARSSVAFGIELTAPLTQTDVARIANLLRDGLTSRYDNNFTLGPTHVIEGDDPVNLVWDDTGTEAGTHAAMACAPPSIALVVTKQTGLSGRRFRGRLFMPGVDESAVGEDGIIVGSEVNAWQANFDALQTALIADVSVTALALFHDESSPSADIPTEISSFRVRNVVGSMRPRQRR